LSVTTDTFELWLDHIEAPVGVGDGDNGIDSNVKAGLIGTEANTVDALLQVKHHLVHVVINHQHTAQRTVWAPREEKLPIIRLSILQLNVDLLFSRSRWTMILQEQDILSTSGNVQLQVKLPLHTVKVGHVGGAQLLAHLVVWVQLSLVTVQIGARLTSGRWESGHIDIGEVFAESVSGWYHAWPVHRVLKHCGLIVVLGQQNQVVNKHTILHV
jgi:hypothetical protein